MNKVMLLRIVNMVLASSLILQVVTVMIIFLRIKTPYTRLIFDIHEYNGLFMITLVAIHITLNWGWIKANIFKKR